MAPTRSKARAPRRVPYDPDVLENWTLQRLRTECAKLGIHAPTNCKRSLLIRRLRNSEESPHSSNFSPSQRRSSRGASQTQNDVADVANPDALQPPTHNPMRADNQNGRLDTMEGVLTDVLDSLSSIHTQMRAFEKRLDSVSRQSQPPAMSTTGPWSTQDANESSFLAPEVPTMSTNPPTELSNSNGLLNTHNRSDLTLVPVPSHSDFTLASAYNNFRLSAAPTASGSTSDQSGPRPSAVRSRFGYTSQSIQDTTTISPALRTSIIQGRDINLAALLVPYFRGSGDNSERISNADSRDTRAPNRPLTLAQFIQAFAIYKSVMCTAYPHRREELDLYEVSIVNMASRHRGQGFYDYHCQFSARAASLLRFNNICIDWSVRDEVLYNNIFSGRPVNACAVCNSTSHDTSFCPLDTGRRAEPPSQRSERYYKNTDRVRSTDLHGRPRVYHQNKEICNNFNGDAGCRTNNCPRAHVCSACKGDHAKSACPLEATQPPPKKR